MTRQTIGYQPAIDGVRAVSVVAVLLFHAGYSWMSGGYLGVSVFFTLSGYLITSLLLVEHERSGTVDVRAFYSRRARRLLPASLLCVVGVAVLAARGWFAGVDHLRRDVFGALFQVFNWVKLGSGESYADLTASKAGLRRPLDHYWSLAIEEQFYWIWPLAMVGVAALCRRRGITPTRVVATLFAASMLAAPLTAWAWGPDAAYWATPARVAEIFAGALVACVFHARPSVRPSRWLAPLCLAVLAVSFVAFPDGHGPAYQGALPLVALVSAGLVAGLQGPGVVRSALSARPLVAIGKVSYGIYLYHWPVFVIVDRQTWDIGRSTLLVVKLALTLAIATVSYLAIEQPVRRATWAPRRTLVAAAAAMAAVAAIAFIVPTAVTYFGVDAAAAEQAAIDTGPVDTLVTVDSTAVAVGGTTPTPVPSRPVRIVVVGDSTAEATGAGLVQWAAANPSFAQVEVVAGPGCGLVLGGTIVFDGADRDVDEQCRSYINDVALPAITRARPDVVMVMSTVWDLSDRRLEPNGPALTPTDAALRAYLTDGLGAFTDALLAAGAPRVAWIREPVAQVGLLGLPSPESQPARHEVMWSMLDEIAASRDYVTVLDLAGYAELAGYSVPGPWRPDGVHWSPEVSLQIAQEWLGPELIKVALQ